MKLSSNKENLIIIALSVLISLGYAILKNTGSNNTSSNNTNSNNSPPVKATAPEDCNTRGCPIGHSCISNKCVWDKSNGLVFEVQTAEANEIVAFHTLTPDDPTDKLIAHCGPDGETVELIKCKYADPGKHEMSIQGRVSHFVLYSDNSREFFGRPTQFINLKQWGKLNHFSFAEYMFAHAHNLTISDPNPPNFRHVNSMKHMFYRAKDFNSPVNHWNVSYVFNMHSMFEEAEAFNQPLDQWNVSNVSDISDMFRGAKSFNQPLNNWNVSNVTTLNNTFRNTPSFNQPLNHWNVSHVINMYSTFESSSFNQPLNDWDVSQVITMSGMFANAKNFNQPLNNWNVSNVANMNSMFWGATDFNQQLNSWNVSQVTNMKYMFRDANLFNQPLNNWNVSNVLDMTGMFLSSGYNTPIVGWALNKIVKTNDIFDKSPMKCADFRPKSTQKPVNNANFWCME